ncbi:MAG: helix-turn-helix domain-containing protein [Ramlibacter sp.]|nr:helix-turn-helix domain-containing protein [Ramlibacter sp.]
MSIHKRIKEGRERLGESEESFAKRFGYTRPTVQQWERENGTAPKLDKITDVADAIGITLDELIAGRKPDGTKSLPKGEYLIQQYKTGGAMGDGVVLRDQPGVIRSWQVTDEWVRANVPNCSSPKNLRVVTGFGDSMKGLYNSGDPLIVDVGVQSVAFDAVYFFRVENEGFIKRLQRIPGEGILAISENKAYRDWYIKPGMDFEVFGRVLKAWVGTEY